MPDFEDRRLFHAARYPGDAVPATAMPAPELTLTAIHANADDMRSRLATLSQRLEAMAGHLTGQHSTCEMSKDAPRIPPTGALANLDETLRSGHAFLTDTERAVRRVEAALGL